MNAASCKNLSQHGNPKNTSQLILKSCLWLYTKLSIFSWLLTIVVHSLQVWSSPSFPAPVCHFSNQEVIHISSLFETEISFCLFLLWLTAYSRLTPDAWEIFCLFSLKASYHIRNLNALYQLILQKCKISTCRQRLQRDYLQSIWCIAFPDLVKAFFK